MWRNLVVMSVYKEETDNLDLIINVANDFVAENAHMQVVKI